MKGRCYNPNAQQYPNYGGRGISVCPEWVESYVAFYDWAHASGYADDLTLDREDNDGDYTPDNCRWVDWKTQQRNRRSNTLKTVWGETKTVAAWAEDPRCVVVWGTLKGRLKWGWSMERALTEPLVEYEKLEAFGEQKNLRQWSQDSRCEVPKPTLYWRVRQGYSLECALRRDLGNGV